MFTVGSLFSGIGGLDLAAQWAGFHITWQVEIDPFCHKVLAKHWPNVERHGDIYECHDLPHADVICAGFPCQPFSIAGKRKGRDDERYLIPEMLRVIEEGKPHVVLLENVPGFTNLTHGAEFKALLQALADMGYDAEWGHLRASDFGAPHKRERWFLVAYTSRGGRSDITFGDRQSALVNAESGSGSRVEQRNFAKGISPDERVSASGPENVADSFLYGDGNPRYWYTDHHAERNPETPEYRWYYEQHGVSPHRKTMGNTEYGRRGGRHSKGQRPVSAYSSGRADSRRTFKPAIRRTPDGLSGGLDFPGFPARPGENQHIYEPPRLTSGMSDRTSRLKALGNAVVPQVAYPLLIAIHAWLEEVNR